MSQPKRIRVRKVIGLRLGSHHTIDGKRILDDQSGVNLDRLERTVYEITVWHGDRVNPVS